ncbi:MAG: YciI family protein [Mycobacteriales bacterium]
MPKCSAAELSISSGVVRRTEQWGYLAPIREDVLMAGYLILIYGDEEKWTQESEPEQQVKGAAHRAFVAAGGAVTGGALDAVGTAKTLRGGAKGRPTVTDGPFIESKEVIGGYYVIDAPDMDEAIRLASLLPELATTHCAVEVRPVMTNG